MPQIVWILGDRSARRSCHSRLHMVVASGP
jgi:hypothetical protein